MELENKVKEIVQRIADDARNKWSSYEQEDCEVQNNTNELVKLLLPIVSIEFKEKCKKDIEELEQRYKDTFNNTEMAYTDENWGNKLITIKGEIKALKRALNYC